MTWDPELDDPIRRPRPVPAEPGDFGADHARDFADEAPPAYRTEAPRLTPIDPNAPVSGHVPPRQAPVVPPPEEHEWDAARAAVHPILRPVGTTGMSIEDADVRDLSEHADRSHSQPIVDAGPHGLVVAYALPSAGFDVIVNADHVVAWGVPASDVRDAAMANLRTWSNGAGWTEEEDGGRRLLSSDTGEGWDAARILLPEVRVRIADQLGADGARVLVGVPERHLLVAGSLDADDGEFATLFAQFIREAHASADEPIDDRAFELVGAELVVFASA